MLETFGTWPKHLVYLSPLKINALFEQIQPRELVGIAKSLTIDVKMVKAEFGAPPPRPDSIYYRLRFVLKFLERRSNIGSIDQPGPYFGATRALVRWGPYLDTYGEEESPLVWFAGETDETVVALGGSSTNLLGYSGDSPTHSHSMAPTLLTRLSKELSLPRPTASAPATGVDWELGAVELANQGSIGTLQEVEFVARRLIYGETTLPQSAPRIHVLLGTPLYVAMSE